MNKQALLSTLFLDRVTHTTLTQIITKAQISLVYAAFVSQAQLFGLSDPTTLGIRDLPVLPEQ